MPGGPKFATRQEAAIAALMMPGITQADAARRASVSERTLRNWLKRDDFKKELRQARRELVESSIGHLQSHLPQAVIVLAHSCLRAKKDSDRIRAALAVVEKSLAGLDWADLIERIEALEAAQKAQKPQQNGDYYRRPFP